MSVLGGEATITRSQVTLYDDSPQSDVGFEITPHAEPPTVVTCPIYLDKLAGQSFYHSCLLFCAQAGPHCIFFFLSFFLLACQP